MLVSVNNHNEPGGNGRQNRLKAALLFISTVLLAIALSAALFVFRDEVSKLGNYGYVGAFLVTLVSSATVLVPAPAFVALPALAATLNPILVALVAATGAIIGELTGFLVGREGQGVVPQQNRLYRTLEGWMKRWGSWAVFVLVSVPLPLFDVAGIISGALGYPLWKFFLIGWAGKIIKYVLLVTAGSWGWEALIKLIGR